jgi:hypothetical protein
MVRALKVSRPGNCNNDLNQLSCMNESSCLIAFARAFIDTHEIDMQDRHFTS